MALTEAQKLAFSEWMKDEMKDPGIQKQIKEAKPGVTFDIDGNIKILEEKAKTYEGAEGKITDLEALKQKAVLEANEKLEGYYKISSELVESLVGHLGKDHKLSKILRNKRDSMSLEAGRGPEKPQTP
ncbi:MAG: hypothetical protein HY841_09710 [Bacteroidetes bacterium]|nr:hypothetical protein [Bacteroidota bacterium]